LFFSLVSSALILNIKSINVTVYNARGHKNISNTLIYTQLVKFEGDEYCSAVAGNVDEAKKLIETGFDFVCNHDKIMLFRKRK